MQYPALGSTVVFRYDTRDEDGALIAPSALGTVTLVVNDVAQTGDEPTHANTTGIGTISVDLSDNALLTSGSWAQHDRVRVYVTGMTVDGVSDLGGWLDDEATIGPQVVSLDPDDRVKLHGTQPDYAPAKAGDAMDLVDAPNATAVGVLQAGLSTYDGSDTSGTTELLTRLSADRAGYLDKLNVAGALANTDNANDFKADVSGLSTFNPASDVVAHVTLVDTCTTNTDMRGTDNAYTGTPPTVGAIADQVWDEAGAGHVTAGTFGARLDAAISSRSSHSASDITGGTTVAGAVTAILAKLLNYVRLLARKDAEVANDLVTELDAINDNTGTGTGTYNNQTDSLNALRDRGDAAWVTGEGGGGGSGSGAYAVTINVKSGATNLQNVDVTASNNGEEYTVATNSSGNAVFNLDADTWTFVAYKPNYVQDSTPLTVVVTGTDSDNITMTYDPPGESITEEDPTMTTTYLTSYDLVCHLRDVIGGDDGEERNRSFKRAVSAVHEDFFADDGWKESLLSSRIEVQAPYSTGTIEFDLTGGSSERLVTLTGGTFPSWAARGSLIIDDEHYRVVSRLSSTTLQLDETFCPTEDIASGTSYILYQDSYLLPADCAAVHDPVDKDAWGRYWIDEETWLRLTTESRIGDDFRFTIMHDDRQPGRYAARFYGYPTEARTLTFLYKRVRKTPVLSGLEANSYVGTIAYTNGSATITGTNTAFSDRMVGSVLRIGDATDVPTDREGDSPYLEEHVITAVASATSLTLKTAVGLTSGSGKKYRVTDPLSFDRANHLALKKGVEAHYWLIVKPDADQRRSSWAVYEEMKTKAREQQSRHRETWSPVSGGPRGFGRPVVNVNAPS